MHRGPSLTLEVEAHSSAVLCIAGAKNGSMVVTGGRDKDVRTWDLGRKACTGRLEGHENAVLCVAITPDGWRIASGGDSKKGDINGVMKLWELTGDRYQCLYTYKTHEKEVRAVALTKDGFMVASGSKDGSVHVFEVGQGGTRKPAAVTDTPHRGAVRGLDFHPDRDWLVSVSEDGTTRVYNTYTGQTLHVLRGAQDIRGGYLSSVMWAPSGEVGALILLPWFQCNVRDGSETARCPPGTHHHRVR